MAILFAAYFPILTLDVKLCDTLAQSGEAKSLKASVAVQLSPPARGYCTGLLTIIPVEITASRNRSKLRVAGLIDFNCC